MSDGWKKVEKSSGEKAWSSKDWEENKQLEGVLVGVKRNVGSNGSNIYIIEEPDGNRVEFWGSTVLDSQLTGVLEGTEVRVVHLGLKKNPKSGREYRDFEVWLK